MTKRSFLSSLKAAADAALSPDWGHRLAAADEAVTAAEGEHRSAALAAVQEVPGAAARLVGAVQALQAARAKKTDLTAAQVAWNAQEAEREGKVRAADAEKQDKAARAAFDAQAALARQGEVIIAAYVQWWGQMREAEAACHAQAAANPRVRQDLAHANHLEVVVRKEISRVATTTPLPPGSDHMAVTLSDKREWQPLGDVFTDLAATVCPDSAKPKRSRAPA
jgi:hypothetical protein